MVDDPAEVSGKDAAWFAGPGVALVSAAYLTAYLFARKSDNSRIAATASRNSPSNHTRASGSRSSAQNSRST